MLAAGMWCLIKKLVKLGAAGYLTIREKRGSPLIHAVSAKEAPHHGFNFSLFTIQIFLIVLARLGTFVCIGLAKFELEKI